MSAQALQQIPPFEQAITDARARFMSTAVGLNYSDEEIFAMQMLTKNDYVFKIANQAPNSVHTAMLNVASTGLTLNPALGYAYLVPRDNEIKLDISFKGLIKIATDTGAIEWVRAECVHEADEFDYRGPAMMPEIRTNPFKDRGAIIGAYCIAKTASGDILTEVMDLAALLEVRSKSTAWTKGAAGKKGPWEDFFSEMCRKAVIKRARKTWPYTEHERMAKAIEVANHAEGGYTFEHGDQPAQTEPSPDEQAARRKAKHDDAAARHSESVAFIKERIAAEDWKAVAAEWGAIGQEDQMALWLATSKGGIFTTAERKAIKERLPKPQTQQNEEPQQ